MQENADTAVARPLLLNVGEERSLGLSIRLWAALFALLIAAATLPRIYINYGADGNGAHSAAQAFKLFNTGVYSPSRLPGNPLFEMLLAGIVPWAGPTGANMTMFLFYLLAVAAFAYLVKQYPARLPLLAVFALTPVMLLNAANTIDYVGALALMLCAYVAVTMRRYLPAALLLGLAIGFRLTSGLFLVPLLLYMILKREKARDMALLTLLSIPVGLIFYVPIFARYGRAMFELPPSPTQGTTYLFMTAFNAVMLFGPLATLAIVALLLLNGKKIAATFKRELPARSPSLVLELVTVALFSAMFVLHSDQTSYLLPIVPFVYLLLARWQTKAQWAALGVVVISFALFNLDLKGGESGRRSVSLKPSWGILVNDYKDRQDVESIRAGMCPFTASDKAVIMTGLHQVLTFRNSALEQVDYRQVAPDLQPAGIEGLDGIYRCKGQQVYYLYTVSKSNVEVLRKAGYHVYMFSDYAPSLIINTWDYDPGAMGIDTLRIKTDNAYYIKGR